MSNQKRYMVARDAVEPGFSRHWEPHDFLQAALDQAVDFSKERPGASYHVLETKYIVTTEAPSPPEPVIKDMVGCIIMQTRSK